MISLVSNPFENESVYLLCQLPRSLILETAVETLRFGHDFKDPAVNNNAPVLATGHQGPGRTPARFDLFKSFVPRC